AFMQGWTSVQTTDPSDRRTPPPLWGRLGGGEPRPSAVGGVSIANVRAQRPWRVPAWIGPGSWALYAIGLMPGLWTFYLGLNDQLGADPLKTLERTLGLW